jgi:hypothetical protein
MNESPVARAAREINDELSIIINSVWTALADNLPRGHPARPALFDISAAARRCELKTRALLKLRKVEEYVTGNDGSESSRRRDA